MGRGPGGGGGGGARLQYEMLGCVCWGSENVPIMKDAKHNHPLRNSYPDYGVMLY